MTCEFSPNLGRCYCPTPTAHAMPPVDWVVARVACVGKKRCLSSKPTATCHTRRNPLATQQLTKWHFVAKWRGVWLFTLYSILGNFAYPQEWGGVADRGRQRTR